MPRKRNLVFANGETYHVYNRTTANEWTFSKKRDIERALNLISFYHYEQTIRYSFFNKLKDFQKLDYLKNNSFDKKIVEIYAYCFMPDHFHLLLRQTAENGIRNFLSNFQNSYAKYFNVKNKRHGSLFQNPFKAKHISSDETLLHVSRYIHLNPVTSYLMDTKELKDSVLTSFPIYLGKKETLVDSKLILEIIGSRLMYRKFVANQVDYQRKLGNIKYLLID
ncbi:MAG TPA: transposase [Patescibacteria group bacterium]|nr:transposase [Patescibacteria group bacterium]